MGKPTYRFILGRMDSNGIINDYPESASLEKNGFVLLFPNKDKLEDYLRKRAANDLHFTTERVRKIDELRIADTMPYPNINHIDVYACAENDEGKINELIEERKRQILNNHGILPEKTFIPYVNSRNDFFPVLEVSFK